MRKSLKALPVLLLGTTCALMAQGAAPVAVLYSKGSISTPDGLFARNDGKTCTISWDGKGEKPVLALDFGAKSVGGYAVFHVTTQEGAPVLRLAYANHPDGLGERGCFWRETSARYLGPTFDIPVLPGNINRHEIYHIGRDGQFVAPLIQGQERYVRVQLDTPGSVTLDSIEIENAEVFSTEPRRGSFSCSDDRLTRLWDISVWTCQIASFPNHDAWKRVGGWILPRKLEQAAADVWCRKAAPADGMFEIAYEFDANPHFPMGRFEILVGNRREAVVQSATNSVRTLKVAVKKGERIGFSVPKESWPVIRSMSVAGQDLMNLDDWDFARTLPYTADGAKRDRLIWSGDLWWAERNLFYGFGPQSPYMTGSVKMLAFNRTPAGYTHASPYAERGVRPPDGDYGPFGSDEFAAWFIPVAYDYYLYTADEETLRGVYPDVRALMGYLAKHQDPETGLFEQRKETCKGAAGLTFGSTSLHHRSYMHVLLWKTYVDAAALADRFGTPTEAANWRKGAEKLAKLLRTRFWDAEKGYFIQSFEDRSWSKEGNSLALAVGFTTPDEAARVMPQLRYHRHGKFQALAARGRFEYGDTEGAHQMLEAHNWYKLLDPSWQGALTVTECMGLIRKGWGDESHPDTAIGGLFSSYVLGVVPTEPGFRTFSVKPQTGGLAWAEGVVPTPYGDVILRWDRTSAGLVVRLTVPQGAAANFAWGATSKTLVAGTHAFCAK